MLLLGFNMSRREEEERTIIHTLYYTFRIFLYVAAFNSCINIVGQVLVCLAGSLSLFLNTGLKVLIKSLAKKLT